MLRAEGEAQALPGAATEMLHALKVQRGEAQSIKAEEFSALAHDAGTVLLENEIPAFVLSPDLLVEHWIRNETAPVVLASLAHSPLTWNVSIRTEASTLSTSVVSTISVVDSGSRNPACPTASLRHMSW